VIRINKRRFGRHIIEKKPAKLRDVFIYFIDGFKPKAPLAAMALLARLSAADKA
jgi:hypothetical protein